MDYEKKIKSRENMHYKIYTRGKAFDSFCLGLLCFGIYSWRKIDGEGLLQKRDTVQRRIRGGRGETL